MREKDGVKQDLSIHASIPPVLATGISENGENKPMKYALFMNRKRLDPCAVWVLRKGWVGVLTLILALMAACAKEKSSETKGGKPVGRESVPVTASKALRKTVAVQVRAIGNVQAYSTVQVRALVGGELLRVNFKEGQDVRKGDLLFQIDPRPFQATLKQVEANLARDIAQQKQTEANLARNTAQLKNAEVEARRFADLLKEGIIAQEQYDQRRTASDALEATVQADRATIENAQAAIQADRAAIENARLQLDYCTIRSQIDGRTGSLIVYPGNIIKANDTTPLVVINQVNPVYVTFSVPEQSLPEIKRNMAAGVLKVEAFLSKNTKQTTEGELTFVDNTVDPTAGTIRLKATFKNSSKSMWPGQFVDVLLTLGTQANVVVVPSQAVQTGQQGQYVFVTKPDLTVESRPVTTGRTVESETVIEKGLEAGERVVTDGHLRLFPGAKVDIKNPGGNDRP